MFENLENLYKEKANYVKNSLFLVLAVILAYATMIIIINIFKKDWNLMNALIIPLLIAVLYLIIIDMIQYKIKPSLKKNIILIILSKKAENIDIEIVRNHLIKSNLYNKKNIENMINHYRSKIISAQKGSNYLEILGIIIAVILVVENYSWKIALIVLSPIMAIIINFTINQYKTIWLILKREESMYENLEEILCTIYAELINGTKKIKE